MASIPKSHQDLLTDEKRSFAFLGTVMANGSPQVTPVWFNSDGEYIYINSAKGRVKDRNMRNHPEVALAIMDPKNPYRYIQIRGRVVDITEQGGTEHIHTLSRKYNGRNYDLRPGEVRVTYKILPEKISLMG